MTPLLTFFCNLFIFIFILLQKVTILKILDLRGLNHLTEKGNNNTYKTLLGMTYLKKDLVKTALSESQAEAEE